MSNTPKLSAVASAPKSSAINDILALTAKPNMISFAGGLPSPAGFPIEAVAEAAKWVMENQGPRALQYSQTQGVLELRQAIADFETSVGNPTKPEEVLIVTGSQQALDLTARAFIDKGSKILVESPTYLGALSAFQLCSPTCVEIPVDDHGMNPAALGDECKGVNFAYVMPTFANPTGLTIDDERRKLLVEKARQYDFWLVEDDPYGELWYESQPPRSLRNLAPERTIRLGTLSKVLSPGMRLGYVISTPEVLKVFMDFKSAVDLHSSTFAQLVSARVMNAGLLPKHLPSVRALYKKQCQTMLEALEQYMPKQADISWTKPKGGMFIWLHLPKGIDSAELLRKTADRHVAFVPSVAFYANKPESNHARLSFVTVPPEQIREGIAVIAEEVAKML